MIFNVWLVHFNNFLFSSSQEFETNQKTNESSTNAKLNEYTESVKQKDERINQLEENLKSSEHIAYVKKIIIRIFCNIRNKFWGLLN